MICFRIKSYYHSIPSHMVLFCSFTSINGILHLPHIVPAITETELTIVFFRIFGLNSICPTLVEFERLIWFRFEQIAAAQPKVKIDHTVCLCIFNSSAQFAPCHLLPRKHGLEHKQKQEPNPNQNQRHMLEDSEFCELNIM